MSKKLIITEYPFFSYLYLLLFATLATMWSLCQQKPVQSITQSAIDCILAAVFVPIDCPLVAVQFYEPICGPLVKSD